MGTKDKSKDPENISSVHAASGRSLDKNRRACLIAIIPLTFPAMLTTQLESIELRRPRDPERSEWGPRGSRRTPRIFRPPMPLQGVLLRTIFGRRLRRSQSRNQKEILWSAARGPQLARFWLAGVEAA